MKIWVTALVLAGGLVPSLAIADDSPALSPPYGTCMWADRIYSNGAFMCWADGRGQECDIGTWRYVAEDNCKGAQPFRAE
jgi:hypothetical protein